MITNYSDHITTDKQEQQELVELYNNWHKDTMFLSSWPASNKYWDEMEKYCQSHKDITVQLWVDMKHDLGTVGHFTYMLQKIMPNVLVPQGYIPLNVFEQIWLCTLGGKYDCLKKTLTIEEPEEWNKFWEDFELMDWYTDLDNPEHHMPWDKKYNWEIDSINGNVVVDLSNDPEMWEPLKVEYQHDFWEENNENK